MKLNLSFILPFVLLLILNQHHIVEGSLRYWASYDPSTTTNDWKCGTLPTLPPAESKAPGVYTMYSAVPKRVILNSQTGAHVDIENPLMYVGSSVSSVYDRIQKKKNVEGFCTDPTKPGKEGTCFYCYKLLTLPNQPNNPDAYLVEQQLLSMFCSLANAVNVGGVEYDANCQFVPGQQGHNTINPMGWYSIAGINLNGGWQDAMLNARCNYQQQIPHFQNNQQHDAWDDQFENDDDDDMGMNSEVIQNDATDQDGKMTSKQEADDIATDGIDANANTDAFQQKLDTDDTTNANFK